MLEFKEFPKIPRLFREVIVTEKIDGTNAGIVIQEIDPTGRFDPIDACAVIGNYVIGAQSRSRIITPKDDNFGFARWVQEHAPELVKLGPGHHFGEWWGQGINRGYDQERKRFSLFNTTRWSDITLRPACCDVVPVIRISLPSESFKAVSTAIEYLRTFGSRAAPGFMKPEGVVAFHAAGDLMFKATLEKDEEWKGKHS